VRFLLLALLTLVFFWGGTVRGLSPSDLSGYPDHPLEKLPTAPITPRFVVEHRSALHGKTVNVRGTVVRVITPEGTQPSTPGGVAPRPGRFAQPRVFLADSQAKDQDRNHELVVLLREGDSGYPVGQLVEIEGTVDGNPAAVVVRRLYPD
jgi:hypothetical protein